VASISPVVSASDSAVAHSLGARSRSGTFAGWMRTPRRGRIGPDHGETVTWRQSTDSSGSAGSAVARRVRGIIGSQIRAYEAARAPIAGRQVAHRPRFARRGRPIRVPRRNPPRRPCEHARLTAAVVAVGSGDAAGMLTAFGASGAVAQWTPRARAGCVNQGLERRWATETWHPSEVHVQRCVRMKREDRFRCERCQTRAVGSRPCSQWQEIRQRAQSG